APSWGPLHDYPNPAAAFPGSRVAAVAGVGILYALLNIADHAPGRISPASGPIRPPGGVSRLRPPPFGFEPHQTSSETQHRQVQAGRRSEACQSFSVLF